jgi:hypothetical protein
MMFDSVQTAWMSLSAVALMGVCACLTCEAWSIALLFTSHRTRLRSVSPPGDMMVLMWE